MKHARALLVLALAAAAAPLLGANGEANASAVTVEGGAFLAQATSHSSDLVVEEGAAKIWLKGHRAVPDYNEETHVGSMPISIECIFALIFIGLIASVPFILAAMVGGGRLTRAHIIESLCLIVWLGTALFLFTNVLKFNSAHWEGSRPLTTVEAVYLLSQILTTVGYGDVTPAFPRGQVWIAINVLFALLLYGSIIMEVTELISKRIEHVLDDDDDGEAPPETLDTPQAVQPLKDWEVPPVMPRMTSLFKSGGAFFVLASIGVCFYHFFPGEEKTLLQAVYMSVITLSTVGFGWFNATTEAGKVFGAFWMLFGVATLAALIGSFVEWMLAVKKVERFNPAQEKLNFYRWVKMHCEPDPKLGDKGMSHYDFMKFGLLMTGKVTEEELKRIEERWEALKPSADGKVSYSQVYQAEGPPESLRKPPSAEEL